MSRLFSKNNSRTILPMIHTYELRTSCQCLVTQFTHPTQQIFTCSKSTIETLEKGVIYLQFKANNKDIKTIPERPLISFYCLKKHH